MSLIHDIQAAAIAQSSDVPTLLRMCKLLAARISHRLLAEWVEYELNGYPDINSLPSYRVIRVDSYGSFFGPFARADRLQIPVSILPENLQERYQNAYMGSGISAYAVLIDGDRSGRIQEAWPLNMAVHHASKIMQDMQCVAAWKEIPTGAVVRLLDSVKTRVLGFVIDLEREAPNAGDTPIGSIPPLSSEKMTQIFNTNISGNVGNISNASDNFSQTATTLLPSERWGALSQQLAELGLNPTDFDGMRAELDQVASLGSDQEKSEAAGSWVGRLTGKVVSGAAGVGFEVAAAGVAKAIAVYLGISGA